MKNIKTKRLSILSLLVAIEIILSVVPFLGFIPLGFINATTLHIPVILAGIMLGKKEGAVLGFVFGLLSLMRATFEPNLTSFVFSPFISIGGQSGNFSSLLIVFVPRILLGFVAGLSFEQLKQKNISQKSAIAISAVLGSLTNTFLVLGGVYLFYGSAYASALQMPIQALFTFLIGLLATSGLAEAFVAVILCVGVASASEKQWRSL